MLIARWLILHPIILVWALTLLALLLGYSMDKNYKDKGKEVQVASEKPVETATIQEPTSSGSNEFGEKTAGALKEILTENKQTADTLQNTVKTVAGTPAEVTKNQISPLAESTNTIKANQAINLLRLARKAYWAGNYDISISYYQKLIKIQPDNIDNKGELANVYWKKGQPQKAAELYADIAMPLIALGKINQVKTMNIFIQQFLPERAQEITEKLKH